MRYELTDGEWGVIKPMLPNKPRGVPRVDDRLTLNGIFWVLQSGAPCTTRTGSGRLLLSAARGPTFRRNAIGENRSALALIYIVRATSSRGSSTGSSIADALPLAMTNSRRITWRLSSWHQSAFGSALYECTT